MLLFLMTPICHLRNRDGIPRIVQAIFLSLSLLTSGCCTPWQGASTVTTAEGVVLCAKHHVPLLQTRIEAIDWKGTWEPVEVVARAETCYRNIIPSGPPPGLVPGGSSRKRHHHSHWVTVSYCPICEKEFHSYVDWHFRY
jgi:hypothetical protein